MVTPTDTESATTTATCLLTWFATYGPHANMICTDGGSHYVAELMRELVDRLGVTHRLSIAYCSWTSPGENGVRLWRRAMRPLAVELKVEPEAWPWLLPVAMGAINCTEHPRLGMSPLEAAVGAKDPDPLGIAVVPEGSGSRVLGPLSLETLRKQADELRTALETKWERIVTLREALDHPDRHHELLRARGELPDWHPGEYVLRLLPEQRRRHSVKGKWTGPCEIIARPSPHIYHVRDIATGRETPRIHASRLRFFAPAHLGVTEELKDLAAFAGDGYAVEAVTGHEWSDDGDAYLRVQWDGFAGETTLEPLAALKSQIGGLIRRYIKTVAGPDRARLQEQM